jgi:hypothetical protein
MYIAVASASAQNTDGSSDLRSMSFIISMRVSFCDAAVSGIRFIDNTLYIEVGDVLSEIFFTLISAKALDRCTGLIFTERLLSFEDVEEFIGDRIGPAVTCEVVGKGDEVASITNGYRCNRFKNVRVDLSRAVVIG